MSVLNIPTLVSFGEDVKSDYIVCSWSTRKDFETLLTIYRKELYRTLFGIRTKYVLDSIEVVPGFINIQKSILGSSDYQYKFIKHLKNFEWYSKDDYDFKKHSLKDHLKYNLDNQEQRIDSFNLFKKIKGDYHCYWKSYHDLCKCNKCILS